MLVLDTNHLRELSYQTDMGIRVRDKLDAATATVVTTVVSAEELLKGRIARLAAARELDEQIHSYERLAESISFIADYTLLPWDRESGQRFKYLRAQGIRIGTMDLRIACITIEHDATLLTRNSVDFAKVPGLRFENWLD